MADPTLSAIDRLYDFVDTNVERLDHALNRTKQVEEKHQARRGKRPEVIDADASEAPKAAKKASTSGSTAVAKKPHYRIVESIAKSGDTLFVVTDGVSRAECSSRDLAEKLLRSMEAG